MVSMRDRILKAYKTSEEQVLTTRMITELVGDGIWDVHNYHDVVKELIIMDSQHIVAKHKVNRINYWRLI